ncbi:MULTISPECIES: M20/M25/M40 family metallo-hydrolase [unclassified Pseudoalteromonas]|uniref:M20/M25/M40 family metallo-hydrolase n=2 Tax=Pseudoalteromonas TaxID=53246 RepID=UPI00110BD9EC|nr:MULTISPECIES: M20/M25/M40 family metallo-hydrolase [unclassified Pseudoalteromonas]MDC9496728.1 M20/M25/M40 family metallo-hydrolase [Pseudoalteromonas sp. Angola-20]MDC9516520.1 M20/M25/M40 family metallo-hydrolase [Pseudoalteromonas sp. Angola-22]MDC9532983.1 M20/M25/M40 family metallo-hydrolase [Pseudoalteromonas sp. Angola-9]TMP84280.1 peptidase M20 [Pseudoalteromonas sp. S983]
MSLLKFSQALIFTLASTVSLTSYAALNKNEREIVKQVEQNMPQALKEIEQAVNINSGSLNIEGVKKVGALASEQLKAIGFKVEWLDGSAFNRAGHVLATHESNDPDAIKILMIGHLDTVFAKHDNFTTYKQIDEHTARGPGVADMKGGNTIIITALKSLQALNLLENVSIKVLLTGDEESSGRPLSLSKKAIVDGAIWADVALGFENGDNNIKTAMAARRGYTGWTLNVTANAAHSSQIFSDSVGYGAIYEASRILNDFREQLATQPNLTFNPGLIVGGTDADYDSANSSATAFGKSNVIAQTVHVAGDLRALSPKQVEDAKKVMQQIVAKSLNGSHAELIFEDGYPPMGLTEGNKKLLALYSQASQDLGYNKVEAANPRNAGAADISFAANHVDMALDGLGLMGSGAHTKNETADLTSLNKNTAKTALLIYRLGQL